MHILFNGEAFASAKAGLLSRIFSVSGDYLRSFSITQVSKNRMRRLPDIGTQCRLGQGRTCLRHKIKIPMPINKPIAQAMANLQKH